MGEPSLTSPVPNVQPYDCSLKMAVLKGTQHKGSKVRICKFSKKLKKNYEFHFRSHVNLHQHLCPEMVTECRVMGCGTLVKKKNLNAHLVEAATDHFALQSREIIKLKQTIFNKVRNQKFNNQMQ